MEVRYKRHFTKSYIILETEEAGNETYELEILSYNRIFGLLTIETQVADGQMHFWYEITGRQTLADYLNLRPADGKLLRLLFQTLLKVCEEASVYLLEENSIWLEPEYIFLDMDCRKMEFLYVPGREGDLGEGFQELMEQLLRKLDHSDKLATNTAYEVYQMSINSKSDFYDVLQQISATTNQVEIKEKQREEQSRQEEKKDSFLEDKKIDEGRKDTAFREYEKDAGQQEQWKLRKGINLFRKKVKEWRFRIPGSKKKRQIEREEDIFYNSKEVDEPCFYVTGEEEGLSHPTELLVKNQGIQGILVYQGEQNRGNLQIDKPVYLIGKQESDVDGYIDAKSVSRIHARIEVIEGAYYIEDMNSTNGTYLNGELLEFRQKVRLEHRDRVTMGVEEYIFL